MAVDLNRAGAWSATEQRAAAAEIRRLVDVIALAALEKVAASKTPELQAWDRALTDDGF